MKNNNEAPFFNCVNYREESGFVKVILEMFQLNILKASLSIIRK